MTQAVSTQNPPASVRLWANFANATVDAVIKFIYSQNVDVDEE